LLVKEILTKLDLGSSVAEHDEALKQYFVETETFRSLINDKVDVVAGDKGTGKSALYKILRERKSQIPELVDVEIISAFNPTGTPVFQRLSEGDILSEEEYIKVWKAYFLALAGNWILEFADGDYTKDMERLNRILTQADLRTGDDSARGVFSKIMTRVLQALRVKTVEGTGKVPLFELSGKLEFALESASSNGLGFDHDEALRLLERVLTDMNVKVWLALDRLDEAFQGRPTLEKPVLRALLRAYLDMQEYSTIRLKLFIRRDLFGRIISGGFVNLTHVNARKVEIVWDIADLFSLLYKRLIQNVSFVKSIGMQGQSPQALFGAIFPEKVVAGSKRPTTWIWMTTRIEDANQIRPPRNLIDLILKSREAQLRQEDRSPREYVKGMPLITAEAIKGGYEKLSDERVEDTLLAESGEYAEVIELFRNGKAEHNLESLTEIIKDDVTAKSEYLRSIGFLGKLGSNYKIPMLYRRGLSITQGKAFTVASSPRDVDEDD